MSTAIVYVRPGQLDKPGVGPQPDAVAAEHGETSERDCHARCLGSKQCQKLAGTKRKRERCQLTRGSGFMEAAQHQLTSPNHWQYLQCARGEGATVRI